MQPAKRGRKRKNKLIPISTEWRSLIDGFLEEDRVFNPQVQQTVLENRSTYEETALEEKRRRLEIETLNKHTSTQIFKQSNEHEFMMQMQLMDYRQQQMCLTVAVSSSIKENSLMPAFNAFAYCGSQFLHLNSPAGINENSPVAPSSVENRSDSISLPSCSSAKSVESSVESNCPKNEFLGEWKSMIDVLLEEARTEITQERQRLEEDDERQQCLGIICEGEQLEAVTEEAAAEAAGKLLLMCDENTNSEDDMTCSNRYLKPSQTTRQISTWKEQCTENDKNDYAGKYEFLALGRRFCTIKQDRIMPESAVEPEEQSSSAENSLPPSENYEKALKVVEKAVETDINGLLERVWDKTAPSDEVLVNGFNIQISRNELLTLAGNGDGWLNDNVIDFYLQLICQRSDGMTLMGESRKIPKIYAFNSFFYPKLLRTGYKGVKQTANVDIFAFDLLLIPIHALAHWSLCVVDFEQNSITYFDSMHISNSECLKNIMRYISNEHKTKHKSAFQQKGWSRKCIKKIPRQRNTMDCGVFVCQFANCIARRASIVFEQKDIPCFRSLMVTEILTKKLF